MNSALTRLTLGALTMASALTMAACSAHVDGGSGAVPTVTPASFNNEVAGPNLDGVWKSGCIESAREMSTWEKLTLTISGQNITRHADEFSDDQCATATKARNEVGLFRYSKTLGSSEYAVDYQFVMPNGTYSQGENFKVESDASLSISNEIGGDADTYVHLTKSNSATRSAN